MAEAVRTAGGFRRLHGAEKAPTDCATMADGSFGKLISLEMTWTAKQRVPARSRSLFDPKDSGPVIFNRLGCHHLDC